ncbi:hypothetical protein ACFS07_08505 [Undibacterium arcticum]
MGFADRVVDAIDPVFLPRQFQIAVVENVDEKHLNKAIWLLPLYLLVINIFLCCRSRSAASCISLAGRSTRTPSCSPLPMLEQHQALALLVFIGGLSAATGMVIVETIALSTMVCNDLVMPLLLRLKLLGPGQRADLSGLLLNIRRSAIVLLMMLGYTYFRLAGEAYALVSIGLISFAAVAQFAPAMLGGIYWKKNGTRRGALVGLSAGFFCCGSTRCYCHRLRSLAGYRPAFWNTGRSALRGSSRSNCLGCAGWTRFRTRCSGACWPTSAAISACRSRVRKALWKKSPGDTVRRCLRAQRRRTGFALVARQRVGRCAARVAAAFSRGLPRR